MTLDPNSTINSGQEIEPERLPEADVVDPALYTRLDSGWREAYLKQTHTEQDPDIGPDDVFSREWNASWDVATLPDSIHLLDGRGIPILDKHGKPEMSVVDTPQHLLLAGHSKYWLEQGARPIDFQSRRERRIITEMERHLTEHFGMIARDLRHWIPEEEAVKPASIRFPESPSDLGLRKFTTSGRSDSDAREPLMTTVQRDFAAKPAQIPTQLYVERSEGGEITQNFYIVAALRNSSGESLACWGNSLARFGPRDEHSRAVFASLPYLPVTLVQLRFRYTLTKPASPTIESDLLYSPLAFKMARQILRDEGIPEAGAEVHDMHGHLIETIRRAIARQASGTRWSAESRPPAAEAVEVHAIRPFSGKILERVQAKVLERDSDDNDLLAICSAGDKKFAAHVRLYIWFPEDKDPGISNRHANESPYTVRCACTPAVLPET